MREEERAFYRPLAAEVFGSTVSFVWLDSVSGLGKTILPEHGVQVTR